jgi:predicted DsbA family dithiol-disulfide isomerase
MTINIWSDIRCPFCYIGKKKFEAALEKFPYKDKVEVVWRSFELDPYLKTQPDKNIYEYLAELKGIPVEKARELNLSVKQTAKEIGLDFNLDEMIVANSFNGHQLIHLAKTKKIGAEAEEALFKANFIDGKNIDDIAVLVQIGTSIGISEEEVTKALSSNAFRDDVRKDEMEANSIGVRGVPFFVLNDKYAVSGAQSPDVFLQALEKSWKEYRQHI